MLLLVFNSIADTKQIEYYIQEYKNIQEEKTSLIKEIREKDEKIKALEVTLESLGIPNNKDARI